MAIAATISAPRSSNCPTAACIALDECACLAASEPSAEASATYPGGKGGSGVWQTIINQIPPHKYYLEPFLGLGTVMFYKRPAEYDVGCELNTETNDRVRRRFGSRKIQIAESDALKVLELVSSELKCGQPIREQLERRALPPSVTAVDVVIYADPPYLQSTRSEKMRRYYEFEPAMDHDSGFDQMMFPEFEDEAWHTRLLTLLDSMPCNVLLSGYKSDLYAELLTPPKWRVLSYWAVTRGGRKVREYLWCNFPEPVVLHDYRYLGRNRRERERIKRKVTRWQNKLAKMPALERQALLAAMQSQ